nr:uncharacterized protein LOC127348331 [Lolium perenne]
MGSFIYGGHGCFYMPSSDNSQPRSAEPQPHPLPLLGDAPDEQMLLRRIRGIEEGLHVRAEPPPNTAAWKFFKTFGRCFYVTVSIALIVWIFVLRHFHLDPYLQDPYKMITLLIFALAPAGFGFMITQGDVEARDTHAQVEAHL